MLRFWCVLLLGGSTLAGLAQVAPVGPQSPTAVGGLGSLSSGGLNDPLVIGRMREALLPYLDQGVLLGDPVDALPGKPGRSILPGVMDLRRRAGKQVRVRVRPDAGTPREISGGILEPAVGLQRNAVAPGLVVAWRFLETNRGLLRLSAPAEELALVENVLDGLGRRHLRFEQRYQGLEVWPGELSVHLNPEGDVDRMNGAYVPTPRRIAAQPELTAGEAMAAAMASLGCGADVQAGDAELIVYGPMEGRSRLAWKFDVGLALDDVRTCVVDAVSGVLLLDLQRVCHTAEKGAGVDGLGRVRELDVWNEGGRYVLVDTSKPMFDPTSDPMDWAGVRGAIVVLDAENTPPTSQPQVQPSVLVLSSSPDAFSGWHPDAVAAAYGLSRTYDYYLERHGRDSLDGVGGSIGALVRYGVGYKNAFWSNDDKAMLFGDGFPQALDVTAHELTHGVIFSTGDSGILNYHQQPGALNEALADIFGEMVVEYSEGAVDWKVGADSPTGVVRDLARPDAAAYQSDQGSFAFPAKMSEFVLLPDSQISDHGGVHLNSTIIGHAFWWLAEGGDQAIGTGDAGAIFYRAMTTHLHKESQFIDMRHACLASAEELFGADSMQYASTAGAFDRAEIFDGPASIRPAPIGAVEGADAVLYLGVRTNEISGTVECPSLYRHESPLGDTSGGVVMELGKAPGYGRISVTGDGTWALCVTEDKDVAFFPTAETGGQNVSYLSLPGSVWSAAVSPDGQRFAYVLLGIDGEPGGQIVVYDSPSDTSRSYELYLPRTEGEGLDVVRYADALEFTPDGGSLFYDACSESLAQDGADTVQWAIFSLDLATGNIMSRFTPPPGVDALNPALGNRRPELMAFELRYRANGWTSVCAADLHVGAFGSVGLVQGDAGTRPCYVGDDSALVYTFPDEGSLSGYSLVVRDVGVDGFTPVGAIGVWLPDAALGTVYRRGDFAGRNEVPVVTGGARLVGNYWVAPVEVVLTSEVVDPDGSIARVDFYLGSELVGSDPEAPYEVTVSGLDAGEWRFVARAVDNLGAMADSEPLLMTVIDPAAPPRVDGVRISGSGELDFSISGVPGQAVELQGSGDLANWTTVAAWVLGSGSVSYSEPVLKDAAPRFYRLVVP